MRPHSPLRSLTGACLSLALLLPAAQALTPEQAGELLETYYVDEVPAQVLSQPTVEAMLEALGDPYTQYFTAQEYADFLASMSDTSLVGIGIGYSPTDQGLLISQVFPGSPAQGSGLQAGDLIVAVDGVSLESAGPDTAAALIRGEEGTALELTYQREGRRAAVTLRRAAVTIPATTGELLDDHIGYIKCTTFGSETVGHFKDLIHEMEGNATAWIVDLRSNSGGAAQAAAEAAGLFTGSGTIAYFRDGEGTVTALRAQGDFATLYPAIVLVDQYSASAAELFAAAIRERQAGVVIGTRTFGKGVAQMVLDDTLLPDYFPDGDAFKITTDRFFSPSGNTTDQVGVIPDLLVEPYLVDAVARLLAGHEPGRDTSNSLRIDMGYQWCVDIDQARDSADRAAVQALLDAVPETRNIWLGTGGSTGWQKIDLEQAAQVLGAHWAERDFPDSGASDYPQALRLLRTFDLIAGGDGGLFRPKEGLTRAQLCQMLYNVLDRPAKAGKDPFSDVPADAWYADAVNAMSALGLVQGCGDGTFRPDAPLDHQQLFTVMARLVQFLNTGFYAAARNIPQEDMGMLGLLDYADWAKPSVWLLGYSQYNILGQPIDLLWDISGKIDADGPATREEAAYLLCRLLTYTGVLPV